MNYVFINLWNSLIYEIQRAVAFRSWYPKFFIIRGVNEPHFSNSDSTILQLFLICNTFETYFLVVKEIFSFSSEKETI